jgi:alpha-galactosidase
MNYFHECTKNKIISMSKKLLLALLIFPSLVSAQTKTLCPTPPMGWNSWNVFAADVDEKIIMEIADAMVSTGMSKTRL